MARSNDLRLIGSSGANRAMEAEVKRLLPRAAPGAAKPAAKRVDEQTLVYPFDPELARLAVHYLRTPSRALWDLYSIDADRLEPLYEKLRTEVAEDDRALFENGKSISVEVRRVESFPAGPLQVRGTVKNAIIEGAKDRGLDLRLEPEAADLVFSVHEKPGGLTISIDLAGQALHLRGWRLEGGPAPLKENLAAQMLILSRWDPRSEVLIDPMAGSGTIAVEGALMALGRRRWLEPRRPKLPAALEVDRPWDDLFADSRPAIIAHELQTPHQRMLKDNLARAGVTDLAVLLHGDLRDLTLKRIHTSLQKAGRPVFHRGLILTNPPYGVRLGDEAEVERIAVELKELSRRLDYRVAVLAGSRVFEEVLGRQPKLKKPMNNGSLPARFLVYEP
jgi:23S rRNA G2445 N2-methylase RlmL